MLPKTVSVPNHLGKRLDPPSPPKRAMPKWRGRQPIRVFPYFRVKLMYAILALDQAPKPEETQKSDCSQQILLPDFALESVEEK